MIIMKMIIDFKKSRKEIYIMPLSMMEQGDTGKIVGFCGQKEMRQHLQDMGFIRGDRVYVVGENHGGMILMVKGVKIALNRALAHRIMVTN
jgi:ferrous iron transport protein A